MKIPYPLRATRISISLMPFGFFGIIPSFMRRRDLTPHVRIQYLTQNRARIDALIKETNNGDV